MLDEYFISYIPFSKWHYMRDFVGELEHFVTQIRVPVLKIDVLSEQNFLGCKVLKNKFVEKLVLTGPCNFEFVPIMENLKEIELHMTSTCTHSKCKYDDLSMDARHRPGLCILNIGAAFDYCPKLEKFTAHAQILPTPIVPQPGLLNENGRWDWDMDLTAPELKKNPKSKKELTFTTWNMRMKKMFHAKYEAQGGSADLKTWAKSMWYKKKPKIPARYGRNRGFHVQMIFHAADQ